MASSNTALSKTAINALRGVIFTTSCSVVLLAEERRRRIKIARAAVDNARKLHAAKLNCGSAALASVEPFNLEARLAELQGESFATESCAPKNPYRRRRRNSLDSAVGAESSPAKGRPREERQAEQRPRTASEAAAVELAVPFIGTENIISTLNGTIKAPRIASRYTDLAYEYRNDKFRSAAAAVIHSTPAPEQIAALPPLRSSSDQVSALLSKVIEVPEAQQQRSTRNGALEANVKKARRYLRQTAHQESGSIDHQCQAAVSVLVNLVAAMLKAIDATSADARGFPLAVSILQRIGSLGSVPSFLMETLKCTTIDLLRYSLKMSPDATTAVLEASLCIHKSYAPVLRPFLARLQEDQPEQAVQVTRNILAFFAQPKHSKAWRDGEVALDIIGLHSKKRLETGLALKMYITFKSAGLFTDIQVPQQMEYDIRKASIVAACAEGQTSFVGDEMEYLLQRQAAAIKVDFQLQAALLTLQAICGNWKAVFDSLEALEDIEDSSSSTFQKYLDQLTDLFAKAHSPEKLGRWIQCLASTYGMVPRSECANAVLDGYAHYHDLDGMKAWLQFCIEHGLRVDQTFVDRFSKSCRKYWGFRDGSVDALRRKLSEISPIPRTYKHRDRHATRRHHLWYKMHELAEQGQWGEVCEVFEAALANPKAISAACLRLAVEAQLYANDGQTEQASLLLQRAKERGLNTDRALELVLSAEVKRSVDVNGLIHHALERGDQLPDSIYNKASDALAANGDMASALDMLKLAAKQVGSGKLAYDEHSFGSLIFTYVATGQYDALEELVSDFISETVYWHGHKRCKESIKFGMKELTRREMSAGKSSNNDRALDVLEHALQHNSRCCSRHADRAAVVDMVVSQVQAREEKRNAEAVSAKRLLKPVRPRKMKGLDPAAVYKEPSIAHIGVSTLN